MPTTFVIGGVKLDLDILKTGNRRSTPTFGVPIFDGQHGFLDLDPQERFDLNGFITAGWRFDTGKEADGEGVQIQKEGGGITIGRLARYPPGGLVILRNRLTLKLKSPEQIAEYQARYARTWQLSFGENLFEVELNLSGKPLEIELADELKFLSQSSDVLFAEPSLLYHVGRRPLSFKYILEPKAQSEDTPELDPFGQWQWDNINLWEAWYAAKSLGAKALGEGTRVAVIDFGFHKDEEIISNVYWQEVLNDEGCVVPGASMPPDFHGTFCAGLIGANSDHQDVNGVAPKCQLILVAIQCKGELSQAALGKALELCARGSQGLAGADVISCSLGLTERSWILEGVLREAMDCVLRIGRPFGNTPLGTPIVWASFDDDSLIQECSVEGYKPLLSVSQSNIHDLRVDSGYGPYLDLLAPGYEVIGISWNQGVREIGSLNGSSLATPCVAGVAALVLAVNPYLTWEQVTEVITHSCDPVGGDEIPNREAGWGRLNAESAVMKALEMRQKGETMKAVLTAPAQPCPDSPPPAPSG